MDDHDFCRFHLKEVMKDVRPHTAVEQRKAAWVWKSGKMIEFHGPDGFYWHGSGHCMYEARAKGWEDWLSSQGANE